MAEGAVTKAPILSPPQDLSEQPESKPIWSGLACGMRDAIALIFVGSHADGMAAHSLEMLKRTAVAFGATYFFWRAFAFEPISGYVWKVVRLVDPAGLPLILVGVTALAAAGALALAFASRPLDRQWFTRGMLILGAALALSGSLVFGLDSPTAWGWLAGHLAALMAVWWLYGRRGFKAVYMVGLAVMAYAWLGATPDICRVPGTTQSVIYDDDRSGYQVVVLEGDEFKSYIVPGTCYVSETGHTPIVLLEGYRDYNVLELGGRFFGIRQRDGAFDYQKFVTGGYNHGVAGDSLEAVKEEIKLVPPERGATGPILVEEGYDGYNLIRYQDGYYAIPQSEGEFDLGKVKIGQYSSFFAGSSVEELTHIIDSGLESSLVQEGYRGYNIIRFGERRYYGIQQGDGPFSLERLRVGGYPQVVQGNSLEEVTRGIDLLPSQGAVTP